MGQRAFEWTLQRGNLRGPYLNWNYLLTFLLFFNLTDLSYQALPKITNLNSENILSISASTTLNLNCEGERQVTWKTHGRKDIESRVMEETNFIENIPNPYRATLIVTNTVYSDTGVFSCYFKDYVDSDRPDVKSDAYVFVNDPTKLLVPVDSHVIPMQQSLQSIIPCLPTSLDVNVTLWKNTQQIVVNGFDVDFDPTKGFLISYATVFYNGNFYCQAQLNDLKEKVNLVLYWFPSTNVVPTPSIDQVSKYATPNSKFWLICTARAPADTFLSLKWKYPNMESYRIVEGKEYSNDVRMANGEMYRETKRNLTIDPVDKSDEGLYTCTVKDHTDKKNEKEIFLEVREATDAFINFSVGQLNPSEPFEVPLGSPEMKFVVTVDSFPPSPQLTWYKGSTPLINGTKYQFMYSSTMTTLSVKDLKREDSDSYVLVGVIGKITKELELTLWVTEPPEITFLNKPMLYSTDDSFNITCQIEGCPPPENKDIKWEWSPCVTSGSCARKYIELDTSMDNEEQMLEFGEFSEGCHLKNVLSGRARQPGFYRCSASNLYGENSLEMPLFLTDYEDKFNFSVSNLSPFEQDNLLLSCHASIFYYSNIQWAWSNSYDTSASNVKVISNTSNTFVISRRTQYSLLTNVTINPVIMNNTGYFICQAQSRHHPGNPWHEMRTYVSVVKPYPPTLLQTNLNSSVYTIYKEDNFEFFCRATGLPMPTISWYLNGTLIQLANDSAMQIEEGGSKLTISRVLPSDSGYYVCLVSNRVGILVQNATLIVLDVARGEGLSVGGIAAVSVVVLLFFVAAIIFGVALGRRLCKERKEKHELEQMQQMLFERGDLGSYNPALPFDEQIDSLPYDKQWEFPKEKLKLGRTLGQGAFGKVVKAEANGIIIEEETTIVAVKMLKERADWEQRKALMQELKIMIHLGRHLNVVNLLGAVTQNLAKGELQVIVEYCRFGNLRHYLLRHRENFIDQVHPSTGELDPSFHHRPSESTFLRGFSRNSEQISSSRSGKDSAILSDGTCLSVPTSPAFDSGGNSEDPRLSAATAKATTAQTLTTYHLVRYAYQVCSGMQYLGSKKLVHRDLALRNILLAEGDIVKICDFGLSKDLYKKDYYRKKGKGPLPIKWMAIESIRDRVFSSESDVWSFGIVLWECFTLGGNPYPGMEVNEEFYKKLSYGYRMDKPQLSTDSMYELMKDCWRHEPRTRPTFNDISSRLGNLLDANTVQQYHQLNEDYLVPKNFTGNPNYMNMLPQDEYVSLETCENTLPHANNYANCNSPSILIDTQNEAVNYKNLANPVKGSNSTPKTVCYGDNNSNNHEIEPMLRRPSPNHYLDPPIPILVPQTVSTNPFQSSCSSSNVADATLSPNALENNSYASSGYLDMGSKLSLDTDVDLRRAKNRATTNSSPPPRYTEVLFADNPFA